jgi:predicted lipoprotein DUF2279
MARTQHGQRVRPAGASWGSRGGLAAAFFLLASLLPATEFFQLFAPWVPPHYYFESTGNNGFRLFDVELFQWPEAHSDALALDASTWLPRSPADHPISLDPALRRPPNRTTRWLVTFGVFAGAAVSTRWSGHERQDFHFGDEGWFGSETYAGGADKASHFVFHNGLSRELAVAYRGMRYEKDSAILMAFATSVAAGLIVEIGDGITTFGFAWEDLAMDALGAGTAALVTHYNLDDTIGFRFGKVSADKPPPCCPTPGIGKDYSEEVYTADLKLAGFARRLNVRPGPARFLLFSMAYGTKGYHYSPPELRQRDIGIELGLNIPEILSAVGVPERKWWGRILYGIFNIFRVPYTSIGVYYDLNQGRWSGPNPGNVFDPRP